MPSESSIKLLLNVAQRMQISCASSLNLESILSESLISAHQRSHNNTAQNDKTGLLLQLASAGKAAIELRNACISTGRVDLKESQRITETWDAIHEEQTRAWAEDALSRARAAVGLRTFVSDSQFDKAQRPVFNHEYTPLLKKYFQYNAYPSAPDKAILARKCMMTPRQIEVWFQNHRNRAKKDNRPLRRLSKESLPATLSLESLEDSMPFFTVSKHERMAPKDADFTSDDYLNQEKVVEMPSTTPQTATTIDYTLPTMTKTGF
ncbi:Mating-type protein A-alpha Y1 [Termitomyces sp. J132]|nr:Mating-type protein A-alpha Y1 [Termitomyces sp. J132]